jgi:hypothetical protein
VVGLKPASRRKEKQVKKAIILGLLIMLVAGCALVVGCGSSGQSNVEGVYKLEAGGDVVGVLTLKANNQATYSLSEDLEGLPVTYKVKDKTIVLIGQDGKELPDISFTVVDDGLRDQSGNLYKKQ